MATPFPKIILHSDQTLALTAQKDQELLRSFTGKRAPRIGYIPSVPDRRRRYFAEKAAYYEKVGCADIEYFDPEENHSAEEIAAFFARDVLHLSGGEVGTFWHRLSFTGCDAHLLAFAQRGGVLLGVSAGAMVLGKTFASASLFGEKGPFDGLGLFDFEIVPHVSEKFPRLELLQKFATTQKKTVYALNDGDIVTIHGQKVRLHGGTVRLEP